MLHIRQAIIVEGKYDKIKLSSIVKAVIIPTHGFRIFKDPDDWKKSFVIRIDQNIDWKKRSQQLLVRVEDKGGMGGIWRPVWIVCR